METLAVEAAAVLPLTAEVDIVEPREAKVFDVLRGEVLNGTPVALDGVVVTVPGLATQIPFDLTEFKVHVPPPHTQHAWVGLAYS